MKKNASVMLVKATEAAGKAKQAHKIYRNKKLWQIKQEATLLIRQSAAVKLIQTQRNAVLMICSGQKKKPTVLQHSTAKQRCKPG